MKIRATRSFLSDIGMVRRGSEVDVRDVQAASLVKRGLAVELDEQGSEKPEKDRKPKGKTKSTKTGAKAPPKGE